MAGCWLCHATIKQTPPFGVSPLAPDGACGRGCGIEIEYCPPAQTPTNGIVSVPSAAFTPYEDGYAFFNAGWNLIHNNGVTVPGNRGWYEAPVCLPDSQAVASAPVLLLVTAVKRNWPLPMS